MLDFDKLTQRLGLLALAYSVSNKTAYQVKTSWRKKFDYTLYISSKDPLVIPVLNAIMKDKDLNKFKSLSAAVPWTYGKGYGKEFNFLMYLKSSVPVDIDGHKILIGIGDGIDVGSGSSDSPSSNAPKKAEDVYFICRSSKARSALIQFFKQVARDAQLAEKIPQLYTTSSWGSWEECGELVKRPFESVVLPEGQLENLVADLQQFFDSENDYLSRGMPWHRGILLYGPPGTGKSSLALMLANYFKSNLYTLSLNDLTKDSHLVGHVNSMEPRSFLILEDIDVQASPVSHEEGKHKEAKVTLSSLLNVLDGITSPHGIVTIMTTNHIDELDESLIRKGRIDLRLELGFVTQDQLERLYTNMCRSEPPGEFPSVHNKGITPADICSVIKDNNYDPALSFAALTFFIASHKGLSS